MPESPKIGMSSSPQNPPSVDNLETSPPSTSKTSEVTSEVPWGGGGLKKTLTEPEKSQIKTVFKRYFSFS